MFSIFGSPRSGTTLLASILDMHSEVIVPPETDFIIPAAFLADRIGDPAILRSMVADIIVHANGFAALSKFISAEEARDSVLAAEPDLYAMVDAVFARIAANAGVRIAGDKSPNDLRFARMLEKRGYFSRGMKVVHLVRDVRGVVESLARMNWRGADDPIQFARTWNHANMSLAVGLEGRPEYLRVRYEDLAKRPEEAACAICHHLGLKFEPSMLAEEGRGAKYPFSDPAHQRLRLPISGQWTEAWRERLPPQQIMKIEQIAGEGLAHFGYALATSKERTALAANASASQ
jgi:hypothetical protein